MNVAPNHPHLQIWRIVFIFEKPIENNYAVCTLVEYIAVGYFLDTLYILW